MFCQHHAMLLTRIGFLRRLLERWQQTHVKGKLPSLLCTSTWHLHELNVMTLICMSTASITAITMSKYNQRLSQISSNMLYLTVKGHNEYLLMPHLLSASVACKACPAWSGIGPMIAGSFFFFQETEIQAWL